MEGTHKELAIGVFDSGVGGISVLAEMLVKLPGEKFIYFADSLHAPYGTKDVETVRQLSVKAADFLYGKGIKALVVACNTATSVAINEIREKLPIPVIGMEPAVKPAVELCRKGKILVMATPMTLKEKKFNTLVKRFDETSEILPVPCPGLVELIEKGYTQGQEVQKYLKKVFSDIDNKSISSVVLGCTHYIFIRDEVRKYFGNCVEIIDGNCGTAKQLKRVLDQQGFLKEQDTAVNLAERVKYLTSGSEKEVIPLCKKLLNQYFIDK